MLEGKSEEEQQIQKIQIQTIAHSLKIKKKIQKKVKQNRILAKSYN